MRPSVLVAAVLCAALLRASGALKPPVRYPRPDAVLSVAAPALEVLQSLGTGSATLSAAVACSPDAALEGVTLLGLNELIATGVRITTARTRAGFNISCALDTDGRLGFTHFRLRARTRLRGVRSEVALPCSLDVLGVQLIRGGQALPTGKPLRMRKGARSASLIAKVYAGRNRPAAKLSDCKVRVVERGMRKPNFLGESDVTVTGNLCRLTPKAGATTKGTHVAFECPAVTVDGEVAEAEVNLVSGS